MNGQLDEFYDITQDLLKNEKVNSMRLYNHHGKISTHYHSVYVAFSMYKLTRRLGFDEDEVRDITRAALLHDLYLYDWHTQKHDENHMYYHPKETIRNIDKYHVAELTQMQREMILTHMFPAGPFPLSRGGWLLTLVDKHCANRELMKMTGSYSKDYQSLLERIDADAL